LYGYVLGDPVNKIDPNGLNWLDDFIDLGKDNNDTNKSIDDTKGYDHKGEDAVKDLAKESAEKMKDRNKKYDDFLKELEEGGPKCVY